MSEMEHQILSARRVHELAARVKVAREVSREPISMTDALYEMLHYEIRGVLTECFRPWRDNIVAMDPRAAIGRIQPESRNRYIDAIGTAIAAATIREAEHVFDIAGWSTVSIVACFNRVLVGVPPVGVNDAVAKKLSLLDGHQTKAIIRRLSGEGTMRYFFKSPETLGEIFAATILTEAYLGSRGIGRVLDAGQLFLTCVEEARKLNHSR